MFDDMIIFYQPAIWQTYSCACAYKGALYPSWRPFHIHEPDRIANGFSSWK